MALKWISIATIGLLGACQPGQGSDGANANAPATPSASEAATKSPPQQAPDESDEQVVPPASIAPTAPEPTKPSTNTPSPPTLPEPKGPIDPKSVEAAGQVVQKYGALIEQGRWNEARGLWGNAASADAFARQLRADREVHLNIGNLGQPEGAAGSIYVTEPVTFYGKRADGKAFERKAVATLRRVNNVDGSTAAQRRWHIERIEWK